MRSYLLGNFVEVSLLLLRNDGGDDESDTESDEDGADEGEDGFDQEKKPDANPDEQSSADCPITFVFLFWHDILIKYF